MCNCTIPLLFSAFLFDTTYAQRLSTDAIPFQGVAADFFAGVIIGSVDSSAKVVDNDTSEQRDVFDILKMAFNIKASPSDPVSKEKGKLYVAAIPAAGYSLNTGFAVTIGANAGVYTDNIDSVNLSTFNFNPTYTFKRQILMPVQSNVWTSGRTEK